MSVGDIFNHLLKKENLDTEYDYHRAIDIWPIVVGPGINRYTISRSVNNGIMTVWLSSAPLRNEMMLTKSQLISRLNEELGGKQIIKDIIFK